MSLFSRRSGTVTTTQTVKIVEIDKKGRWVKIRLERHGIKVDNLPMDSVEAGPWSDSELVLRKGNRLELPHDLTIKYYP